MAIATKLSLREWVAHIETGSSIEIVFIDGSRRSATFEGADEQSVRASDATFSLSEIADVVVLRELGPGR